LIKSYIYLKNWKSDGKMVETILDGFVPEQRVLLSEIYPSYAQHFLNPFLRLTNLHLVKEFKLTVPIRKKEKKKTNPTLRLAEPQDAEIIAEIVREDYEGTYPYKEMEDPLEIRRMIISGKYKFMLFVNEENEIVGSTCFVLNLKEKKGYLRSLVVRKRVLGILDATKAYIGSCLAIWNMYKDKILIWWGEARTADAKSQYINRLCSVRPIAFLPNKDIFYNKIESDLVMISYNERVFTRFHSKKRPQILPCVARCFYFADMQYDLSLPEIVSPRLKINLNIYTLTTYFQNIIIEKTEDDLNYITYKFSIKNSDSYFKFLYTPRVQNFEKTEYKINKLEELFVFLQYFKRIARVLDIRYMESHVSAYKPSHQILFRDIGLTPRGYIPAFNYNKSKDVFEDSILFNYYKEPLSCEPKLIPEGKQLLKFLNMRVK
jgi:hypothetical protein